MRYYHQSKVEERLSSIERAVSIYFIYMFFGIYMAFGFPPIDGIGFTDDDDECENDANVCHVISCFLISVISHTAM